MSNAENDNTNEMLYQLEYAKIVKYFPKTSEKKKQELAELAVERILRLRSE
tara:strand:+ start:397 stop:549 length:153 start_codon:yes stop_codon:yes gene_type:complete